MRIKTNKKIIYITAIIGIILLSGCSDIVSNPPKINSIWYSGRCGNVCPIGNAETYVDNGGRDNWQCICVDTNWGEYNVTYHCQADCGNGFKNCCSQDINKNWSNK